MKASLSLSLSLLGLLFFGLFPGCEEPVEEPWQCLHDTTSHNFVWEVDTLGMYFTVLYDIAIVDQNDIWAVGEISTPETNKFDSMGVWQTPYNLAHWDGSEWELMKVMGKTYYDSMAYGPIKAVYAFSTEDIWVSFDFGSYARWNGLEWESEFIHEREGIIKRIWGTSSENLYFVGSRGNITHYNGLTFEKMESGTELTLRSIDGTSENKVFISGHENLNESVVLEKSESGWSVKYYSETTYPGEGSNFLGRIYQVFTYGDTLYVDARAGLWKVSIISGKGSLLAKSFIQMNNSAAIGIDGNSYNNIFICSWDGQITHFNGKTWKKQPQVHEQWHSFGINLYSMQYRDSMFVAAGTLGYGAQGFIIRGYHLD